MRPGPTRYTQVGDAQVAYQVTGDGEPDVLYMQGTGSNFSLWWEWPAFAHVLERFASIGRLILFDRRGSGISDPLPAEGLASWEQLIDDLGRVLNAAESSQAVVIAAFDAGPIALTYAATNPERVRALVLWNSYARFYRADDYPVGLPEGAADAAESFLLDTWGTEAFSRALLPDQADDDDLLRWHGLVLRGSCTPASYARQVRLLGSVDARPALPLIQAPTLVLHSAEYAMVPAVLGEYVAAAVPKGRFVPVAGPYVDMWANPRCDEIVDLIEEFATGQKPAARQDRVLAGVLFTDIVGSTERAAELGDASWKALLDEHDRVAHGAVTSWRGRVVKTTGDGLLATFDGPGRAISCALDLRERTRGLGLDIRAGVHFGEIERRRDGDVGGLGVHVAARVLGHAAAGSVMCTRTVKELSLGSTFAFEDRGTHTLKGVPDKWELFAIAA